MIAWIVIGGVVLFLALLLLCPLKVTLRYGEGITLVLRYAFLQFRLLPAKEKPEKQPKKEKKPKKETPEGEKQPSFLQKLKAQHGVSGLLWLAKELTRLAGSTLKKLFSHVVVYHLHGDIRLATGDAAQTAILYGKACAVLEPCVAVLLPLVPKKKRRDVDLYVTPDFVSEVSDIRVYAQAGIRPLFLFSAAFGALFRFFRIYLAAGQRAKARADAAGQAAENTNENNKENKAVY